MRPRDARIRPLGSGDAADLYRVRLAPRVMEGTLGLPTLTPDRWRREVEAMLQNPDNHCLVADIDGEVVGAVNLDVGRGRKSHSATLGIMVRDDFAGRGLGSRLLDEMISAADDWLAISRIELEVFADHGAVVGLYESRGFAREGLKRRAAFRGGEYRDVLVMARLLPDKSPSG